MIQRSQGNLIFTTYSPAYSYPCKILVTYIFITSRPPRGMAGYFDWITDGRISDLLLKGKIRGRFCESLLIVTRKRIKAPMVIITGAGDPKELQLTKIRELGKYTCIALHNLKIAHFGLYPHDLFLSHLDKSLVINELIEGFKDTISNDLIIGLLSNNQEQKEIIDRWLELYNHENYYPFRHTWKSGGPAVSPLFNRQANRQAP